MIKLVSDTKKESKRAIGVQVIRHGTFGPSQGLEANLSKCFKCVNNSVDYEHQNGIISFWIQVMRSGKVIVVQN
jgi:hypothetical protein